MASRFEDQNGIESRFYEVAGASARNHLRDHLRERARRLLEEWRIPSQNEERIMNRIDVFWDTLEYDDPPSS